MGAQWGKCYQSISTDKCQDECGGPNSVVMSRLIPLLDNLNQILATQIKHEQEWEREKQELRNAEKIEGCKRLHSVVRPCQPPINEGVGEAMHDVPIGRYLQHNEDIADPYHPGACMFPDQPDIFPLYPLVRDVLDPFPIPVNHQHPLIQLIPTEQLLDIAANRVVTEKMEKRRRAKYDAQVDKIKHKLNDALDETNLQDSQNSQNSQTPQNGQNKETPYVAQKIVVDSDGVVALAEPDVQEQTVMMSDNEFANLGDTFPGAQPLDSGIQRRGLYDQNFAQLGKPHAGADMHNPVRDAPLGTYSYASRNGSYLRLGDMKTPRHIKIQKRRAAEKLK
jgi:hypothetical protein